METFIIAGAVYVSAAVKRLLSSGSAGGGASHLVPCGTTRMLKADLAVAFWLRNFVVLSGGQLLLCISTSGVALAVLFFFLLILTSAFKHNVAEPFSTLKSEAVGSDAASTVRTSGPKAETAVCSHSQHGQGKTRSCEEEFCRFPAWCSSSGWGLVRQVMKSGLCHGVTHCQRCAGI